MPKTRSKKSHSARVASPVTDISAFTLAQMARLPAKSLRQHLSSRHLNSTGTKNTMAKRLYDNIHSSQTPAALLQQVNNSTPIISPTQSLQDSQLLTLMRQLLAQAPQHPIPPTGCTEDNLSIASQPLQNRDATPPTTAINTQQHHPSNSEMLTTTVTATLPQVTNSTPMMPPVPTHIKDHIINGKFIDFATLLPQAMFTGGHMEPTKVPTDSPHKSSLGKGITNFVSWMEAWNVYISVVLSHSPERALEMIGYQRLITTASNQLPFPKWFAYDVKFRTLAAADPTLHWDQRHVDLWLECIAPSKESQRRWPCSFCGSTFHFPENCPKCPFRAGKQPPKPPDVRRPQHPICRDFNSSQCTRAACKYHHICAIRQGNPPAYQCWGFLGNKPA